MKQNKFAVYNQRMENVCQYISEHLSDDLSVEKLSQVAFFSKYHFHRQFSSYTGITVSQFILMARLKQASYQLVYQPELSILEIALIAKFENPGSFSRAFKKAFAQTPSQFRKNPQWQAWHEKLLRGKNIDKLTTLQKSEHKMKQSLTVDIITFDETKVAALEHQGAPSQLNYSVSQFIEWRKSTPYSPVNKCKTFGIAYHDPATVKAEEFRFDVCGEVKETIPENPQGVINKVIPAGRCAKLRHLGSHDSMDEKIRALYQQWLPESGEELRDYPCFFHYINLFPQVEEHQLITDIYLPLK